MFSIAEALNNPSIPNFEILGRIGGGAYGEVYLARSVTGMFRAVKVVQRTDFEYERTFEREFEGIQKYEQVSQNHPGLVDVLHVGRNDSEGYYYYVMELADDESGEYRDVDIDTYSPKTLSSEFRRKPTHSVRDCVELGISLAGALGHLHQAGLTHRDVKPSNIIFVNGKPKLADVGLVASSGQRTYVGTEGYVPPEGPGTSSADLYSLAMVLYEMHTGKDRLDFPELPTNMEIPPTVNRDEWRSLNTVICRAGSPDPRKRFETAGAFAKALQGVIGLPEEYTSQSNPGSRVAATGLTILFVMLIAAVGGIGWWLWDDHQSFQEDLAKRQAEEEKAAKEEAKEKEQQFPLLAGGDPEEKEDSSKEKEQPSSSDGPEEPKGEKEKVAEVKNPEEEPKGEQKEDPKESPKEEVAAKEKEDPPLKVEVVNPPAPMGQVKIMSQPSGARVWLDGEEIGITETRLLEFEPGPIEFVLKLDGYHDYEYSGTVNEGVQVVNLELLPDLGPIPGNPWVNYMGVEFTQQPSGVYRSNQEISSQLFEQYLADTGKAVPYVALEGLAQVRDEAAVNDFCRWMTNIDRQGGYLGPDKYYRFERNALDSRRDSFYLVIDDRFGILILNSEPPGAQVYDGEEFLGETPVTLNQIPLGKYSLKLIKPGYETAIVEGELGQEPIGQTVEMQRDASVVFGQEWSNSMGMPLVPVGDLMVATFETRVSDFSEFIQDTRGFAPNVDYVQPLNHPVAGVNLAEAKAFCSWLTIRERAAGLIRPWQEYRLPSDREWSNFAGIDQEAGNSPAERSQLADDVYPWGNQWPPPEAVGNYADAAAGSIFGKYVIEGYNDGFVYTSPVGSFQPAPNGLYDLSGNVWEWVLDSFGDSANSLNVVRGGAANSYEKEVLVTGYRNAVPATSKERFYGFRYVLEDVGNPDAAAIEQ
ncbi:MAG: hypothetical protein CMO55_13570 [Verrucomicrobiales bacterium]|nr:hypothetical protein [Verrucomicrobiales bacterium]